MYAATISCLSSPISKLVNFIFSFEKAQILHSYIHEPV